MKRQLPILFNIVDGGANGRYANAEMDLPEPASAAENWLPPSTPELQPLRSESHYIGLA